MSEISILHLSDFHFNEITSNEFDNKILYDKLLDDIKEWRNNREINIDFIFITGDIAYAGKENEYDMAYKYINRISKISDCPLKNIFIVPGNHDLDLSRLTDNEKELWEKIRTGKIDINDELVHNLPSYQFILEKFRNYFEFVKHFNNPFTCWETTKDGVIKPWYSIRINIKEMSIRIIGLTTVLFTGKTNADLGVKTYICQLKDSLNDVAKDELIICLSHCSLSDVENPKERKEIQNILAENGIINMCGHTHETQNIIVSIAPYKEYLSLSTGCLYVSKYYESRYNILKIDPVSSELRLWPRRWFKTAKIWSSDPEVGELDKDKSLIRDLPNKKVKIQSSLTSPLINVPSIKNSQNSFSIKITSEKDTILTGGESSYIIAQIYLEGLPCKYPGIKIDFSSDNNDVATLPQIKSALTDENGQAWILLTSHDIPGIINIFAVANINSIIIKDATSVKVVEWGNIIGKIYDINGIGIPNATITLWHWAKNDKTGQMERTSIVHIPNNPQLSNDGRTSMVGQFIYDRVPSGIYCITGEKSGHYYFTIVRVEKGTVTANIVISNFIMI